MSNVAEAEVAKVLGERDLGYYPDLRQQINTTAGLDSGRLEWLRLAADAEPVRVDKLRSLPYTEHYFTRICGLHVVRMRCYTIVYELLSCWGFVLPAPHCVTVDNFPTERLHAIWTKLECGPLAWIESTMLLATKLTALYDAEAFGVAEMPPSAQWMPRLKTAAVWFNLCHD